MEIPFLLDIETVALWPHPVYLFTMRWLSISLLLAAASLPCCVDAQARQETRHSYVPYPESAHAMLQEEVAEFGEMLDLDVVTSVARPLMSRDVWHGIKGTVRRMHNQNQVLHVSPHFFITNGADMGCRLPGWDDSLDDLGEENLPEMPLPLHCETACTNHGRYCVVPYPDDPQAIGNARGAILVEETLRRICFVELYHGSDLRFWYVF